MPIAIVGSTRFYATFVDLISEFVFTAPPFLLSLTCLSLGIIGYWSASYSAIVVVEHIFFRRSQFRRYNVEDLKYPRRLPLGVAAALAFFGSFGIIIPCMSQVWYVGPIARAGTGGHWHIHWLCVCGGVVSRVPCGRTALEMQHTEFAER